MLFMSLQVRGRVLLRTLANAEERFGREVVERALQRCSPGVRAALRSAVVEGGYYPIVWLTNLEEGLIVESGVPAAMYEIGQDMAPRLLREATQVALHLKSMWSIIHRIPPLLADAFDGARLEIEVRPGGDSAEFRYTECAGFSRHTWELIEGSIVGVLEAAGAHGVVVEPMFGGGDGDDAYTFVARFRGRPSLPPRPL